MTLPKFHWGDPKNPTEIRSWTSAMRIGKIDRSYRHNYITHEVARWYGISFGHRWAFVFCILGKTVQYSSPDKPRVGLGKEWDREENVSESIDTLLGNDPP